MTSIEKGTKTTQSSSAQSIWFHSKAKHFPPTMIRQQVPRPLLHTYVMPTSKSYKSKIADCLFYPARQSQQKYLTPDTTSGLFTYLTCPCVCVWPSKRIGIKREKRRRNTDLKFWTGVHSPFAGFDDPQHHHEAVLGPFFSSLGSFAFSIVLILWVGDLLQRISVPPRDWSGKEVNVCK